MHGSHKSLLFASFDWNARENGLGYQAIRETRIGHLDGKVLENTVIVK